MTQYASGKHAFGFCDRCDQRVPYGMLKPQIINTVNSGLLVCEACLDIDHEQLQLGRFRIDDPQALKDARPDKGLEDSRGYFGWRPVGHELTSIAISVGTVTVST